MSPSRRVVCLLRGEIERDSLTTRSRESFQSSSKVPKQNLRLLAHTTVAILFYHGARRSAVGARGTGRDRRDGSGPEARETKAAVAAAVPLCRRTHATRPHARIANAPAHATATAPPPPPRLGGWDQWGVAYWGVR